MPSLPSSKAHPSSPPDPPPPSSPPHSPTNPNSSSPPDEEPSRFPPAEEASLLTESNQLKTRANTTFTRGDFSTAIAEYDKALASCPNYLDYEIAVLKSNIAACHLKLEDWKAAVAAADAALEGIERVERPSVQDKKKKEKAGNDARQKEPQADDDGGGTEKHTQDRRGTDDDATVVELDPSEDETAALRQLQEKDDRHRAVTRIKAKSLMRRARANSQLGGSDNLRAAEDDYTSLSSMPAEVLRQQDKKVVQAALRDLPDKIIRAKEAEVSEMMGKLKELGNSVLKPLGLSTDMFKMQKDEKTGGYSMSINQEN